MSAPVAGAQLRSIVERIEARDRDRAEAAEDVRGIYKEAGSNGFDVKALRAVVKTRRSPPSAELESLVAMYTAALGA